MKVANHHHEIHPIHQWLAHLNHPPLRTARHRSSHGRADCGQLRLGMGQEAQRAPGSLGINHEPFSSFFINLEACSNDAQFMGTIGNHASMVDRAIHQQAITKPCVDIMDDWLCLRKFTVSLATDHFGGMVIEGYPFYGMHKICRVLAMYRSPFMKSVAPAALRGKYLPCTGTRDILNVMAELSQSSDCDSTSKMVNWI